MAINHSTLPYGSFRFLKMKMHYRCLTSLHETVNLSTAKLNAPCHLSGTAHILAALRVVVVEREVAWKEACAPC